MKRKLALTAALLLAVLPMAAQSVKVVSPNGGESWPLGTPHAITWTFANTGGAVVNITLRNAAGKVGDIKTGVALAAGSWQWNAVGKLSDGTMVDPGTEYIVRINIAGLNTHDDGNAVFSITGTEPPSQPSITVLSPNYGIEEMHVGGQRWPIEWSTTNIVQNVRIVLVTPDDADVGVIAENLAPNSSPCSWLIGQTQSGPVSAGGSYKVRISTMDGSVKDVSDNPFLIREGPKPVIVKAPLLDRLPPLLQRPKLAVTAIDLLPSSEAYFIVFGFKNAGNAPLPPASELPQKPDFKVVIDGREIGRGDLNVPNEALAPGAEIKQTLGGFIKFPAPGDPRPFCLGDQITITLNERNVLGLGSASKTSSLRLIALHNFYDLALNPVTYDWNEGVAHLLVTKVGGGSPPRSKKFILNYTIRGYHPSGTVEHDWDEAVVDTPGPFTWMRTRTILSTDTFPVHIDLPLSKTYSTFYELEFEIRPEFRDEFDERNNALAPVRFDRPN